MKKVTKFLGQKKYSLPMIAGFAIVGVMLTHFVYGAGAATLTLTPASGSYDINGTFTVTVKENSGSETINAVQADLSYDTSKLQFISLSTAGAFNYCDPSSGGGGGNISFACASTAGALTGNQTVGTITFKALVGSGSSPVTFKSSSAIVRTPDAANIWNTSTAGGTYSFTTPSTPTCPSGQTGTYPNCSTPSTGGGGGSTGSTGSTNTKPSGSGSTGSSSSTPTTTPTESTNPTTTPTTVNENGTVEGGTMVAVRVLDDKGNPVADATVTIGNATAKTDKTGVASFTSIKPGNYTVIAKTAKGGQVKAAVTVKASTGIGKVQSFDLKVKAPNYTLIYVILGVVVVAGAGVIAFILHRNLKGPGSPFSGGKKSKSINGDSISTDTTSSASSIDDKFEKIKTETPSPSAVITPKS